MGPSRSGPAAPVAAAHLGLGAFFRAHQAAYTALAPDAEEWGIAAFTGRSLLLADQLTAQDGLYTLLVRGPDGDEATSVGSVSSAHPGADTAAWLATLASPEVRLLTLTVTEAAYHRTAAGGLDLDSPDVAADVATLRGGARTGFRTVPGRLVAALAARAASDAGPLAVVPCDNLLGNGAAVRRVVTELAAEVSSDVLAWLEANVSFVDTEVDRITPRTTPADIEAVRRLTGLDDACPVVTEPFTEWTLAGSFPGGRPAWEKAGALLVDDVTPYETRKLWLLNGSHSLLAYAGSVLGHRTVADAIADPHCRGWVEEWWDEASRHLALPGLEHYRAALLERYANPSIRHLLAQIASDGSQKLPVRVLPVVRAERAVGRMPHAGARALAAWVAHLRGHGAPVADPLAAELQAAAAGPLAEAVPRVLAALDQSLADDRDLTAAVLDHSKELTR
ncbi:fructuronate reductase [Nocardioides terrae]|uniref:Mannitol-1-phosphate 5-dehydrogenase n=1 Tax=Nocardioides terrae TaxID=574651 RepID=A0A1I1L457_9ACTN|nr:mannitol dehydrogenase family protein [Nocardioides terrae]SFC67312.1 fructuronate reductase [Nocardioides terrae]